MPDPLRMHVRPRLGEATLVLAFEGWNDAGEAASGAVQFLMDALRAARLAEIDPEEYYDFTVHRPEVHVDEDGLRRIAWPSFEFRFAALSGEHELVLGVGGEPHLRWRSFSDQVVRLAHGLGIRRVVLLGAFLADVLYSRPVVVSGFGHPPELIEGLGVDGTRYEGPTGIVGVLAERLRQEGASVVSLWAGLPHYITVSPNPRGALALVQMLARLLPLKVDPGPLEQASAAFEAEISQLVASDPALAEYVKELKRRDMGTLVR